MGIMELIIQLIAGAVGGNAVGAAGKNVSLGTAGNSIVGALGGLGGSQLLGLLGTATASTGGIDIMGLLGSAGGGAILTAIIGLIKNKAMG